MACGVKLRGEKSFLGLGFFLLQLLRLFAFRKLSRQGKVRSQKKNPLLLTHMNDVAVGDAHDPAVRGWARCICSCPARPGDQPKDLLSPEREEGLFWVLPEVAATGPLQLYTCNENATG